ncbi:uncharacterized protein LOC128190337 [Crassostrea angulata]|uniref:uncharacterized protein LOC128190337 n=1 Tax=Magallana angulata TaxID=2784310 RepID=UPI0022B1B5E7|nr:uncharacterized protein LOC128190337 [Crassostrea angulata]
MKTFVVALLVACLLYCNGQETCVPSPPNVAEIAGETDTQPRDIQTKINDALSKDTEVMLAVNALSAERALVYQESKSLYTDICPKRLEYVTRLYLSQYKEVCYVVSPYRQRVRYAVCGGSGCYGGKYYKSQCVRTGWTRLQFWVWCPTCGFKLIARWYPQCCSCYRWLPCLQAADEITGQS